MKLLYIVEKFPSPTEFFILNEILQLKKNGFKILLLILQRQKQYKNIPELKDINTYIVYLPRFHFYFPFIPIFKSSLSSLNSQFSLLHFPLSIKTLMKTTSCFLKTFRYYGISQYFAQKKIKCDHIHAHFAFISVDIAYFLSELLKVQYSFTAHAQDIYTNQNKIKQHLPFTKFLVTCTEYNRNQLNKLTNNLFKDKIYRVYHGINLEKWPQKTIRVHRYNEMQILTIARLVEKKGLIYLIKAIKKLIDNGTKVHCTIIGQGSHQASLEKYINSKKLDHFIQIRPFVPQNKLKNYYSNADIFVLPCIISPNGDRDGLPNVIIEAMSIGVPVISTPVSAIPEVIKHKKTGILVKEKDKQAIVDGIKLLINDHKLRNHIIQNARKEIEEKFNIISTTEKLIDIFRKNILNSTNKS